MDRKKKSENKLADQLDNVVDLRMPGFTRNVALGAVRQMVFHETSSENWYQEFLDRINQSVGKGYLPVYRMADGEFIFCVGWRPEFPKEASGFTEKVFWNIKGKLKQALKSLVSGKKTVWGENYSGMNQNDLMIHYIRCLKAVSANGMLALHYTRSPGRFSEQYFEPMCQWFEDNQISVDEKNYTSFYFVYALLCGPDCSFLIRDKSLLIVTSADDQKKKKITRYLQSLGAKDIQYLKISPDKALLDRINLDELTGPVDIAFVAGGIGSVNILNQLRPLNTVCMDIGICLEIFADPSTRGRMFTVPDQFIG